jgi:hypothetical protein
MAIKYNDKSVLESHHVAATFAKIQIPELNIFETFSREDYVEIRKQIINMVLSTDMARHFTDFN